MRDYDALLMFFYIIKACSCILLLAVAVNSYLIISIDCWILATAALSDSVLETFIISTNIYS